MQHNDIMVVISSNDTLFHAFESDEMKYCSVISLAPVLEALGRRWSQALQCVIIVF